MNLKMPRLKWSSETQAVKQGGSLIVTMIVNMIVSFLPLILYFVFGSSIASMGLVLYMGILFVFNLVLLIVLLVLLFTIGKRLYAKIQ